MTQFATALQLSQYLTGDPETVEELDPSFVRQAELLISLVSADIQGAAGSTIEAGTGTVYLAGSWQDAIDLPQRPVRSITSISVDGVALTATGYTWNSGSVIYRGAPVANADAEDPGGESSPLGGAGTSSGRHWGGPSTVVAVQYAWGHEDVPDRILSLTLRACGRIIGNPGNLRQETLGIYSATYADVTKDGSHILDAERRWLRKAYNRTAGSFPVAR